MQSEPAFFVETSPYASEWSMIAEESADGMKKLQDFYDYIKIREGRHRAVHEETFSYVVAWSIAELVVVLIVVSQHDRSSIHVNIPV